MTRRRVCRCFGDAQSGCRIARRCDRIFAQSIDKAKDACRCFGFAPMLHAWASLGGLMHAKRQMLWRCIRCSRRAMHDKKARHPMLWRCDAMPCGGLAQEGIRGIDATAEHQHPRLQKHLDGCPDCTALTEKRKKILLKKKKKKKVFFFSMLCHRKRCSMLSSHHLRCNRHFVPSGRDPSVDEGPRDIVPGNYSDVKLSKLLFSEYRRASSGLKV